MYLEQGLMMILQIFALKIFFITKLPFLLLHRGLQKWLFAFIVAYS